MDEDYYNTLARETRQQQREENELKRRILSMTPGPRKTEMWQRNFGGGVKITGEIIDSPVY